MKAVPRSHDHEVAGNQDPRFVLGSYHLVSIHAEGGVPAGIDEFMSVKIILIILTALITLMGNGFLSLDNRFGLRL